MPSAEVERAAPALQAIQEGTSMDIEIRRTSKHSLHAALHAVSQRTCDTPLKVCLSRGTLSPPALPRDKPPVTVPALQCPLKIPRLWHFLRTQIRPGPSKAPKAQRMVKDKEQTTAPGGSGRAFSQPKYPNCLMWERRKPKVTAPDGAFLPKAVFSRTLNSCWVTAPGAQEELQTFSVP